jgi:hypothetical protein
MNEFLKDLKNSLQLGEDFIINDFEDKEGFIVFSKETIADCKKEEYYESVKGKIKADEPIARYFYIEELPEGLQGKGVLTYVMLNPSYAKLEASDPTINRARKWASEVKNPDSGSKYKYFAVINLYPYRHHKPSQMFKLLNDKKDLCAKNCEFIKKYIEKSEAKDFVLAYGTNNRRDKLDKQNELLNLLRDNNKNAKTFFIFGENQEYKPYHLLCTKLHVIDENNKKITLFPLKWKNLI